VFGEVSEGEEALDKINEIYCDKDNKPFQNIRYEYAADNIAEYQVILYYN